MPPCGPAWRAAEYKPLTERDMQRIHETALKLLETVGLAQAIPTCIEAMTAKGAFLNAQGRLCIPRALVEDTLASCARNFVLHARDPKHDMEPSGNKVYFGTAGAAVHIVEPEPGAIANRSSSIFMTQAASSTIASTSTSTSAR
jgi:trimethylamine--corrinoid protein Co-methyltransferase